MDKIFEEGLNDKEHNKWMKNGGGMFDGMDLKHDVMTVVGAIQQIAAQNTGATPLAATHSYYEHNQDWYPECSRPQCRNRTFDLGVSKMLR
jgi:hypothetical protein